MRAEGKIIIIQFYDISQYFDKEMIEDAMITCEKRNVNPKATRLWYKLNEQTKIQVRTGAGLSAPALVGPVVGQGTLGGTLLSQAVLDDGVREQFPPGGPGELDYGTIPMAPCLFQDDLTHIVGDLPFARKSNKK